MSSATFRLTEADREHLAAGAAALGVELSASMVNALARFADILDVWSRKTNLISCGSARELIERHLLDSLAVAPHLPQTGLLVDLGSGAGFPGIPLAIQRPEQAIVLVETRRKRVTFLREVRRTLDLSNVDVVEGRAETPPSHYRQAAAGVLSRAVWSGERFPLIAPAWLAPSGRVYWMRSDPLGSGERASPLREIQAVRYHIGSDRLKTLEIFEVA